MAFLIKYYSEDQIEKNEMGGHVACIGEERCVQSFGGETRGERDHLQEPCIDGRIILIWNFKKWDGSMDWIDMARNRER